MTTAQKFVTSVMVLAAIVGGIFLLTRNSSPADQSEANAPAGAVGVNHYENGVWWFGNGLFAGTSQQFQVTSAGRILQNGLSKHVSAVACTGNSAATSTTFAVANPFAATSTATFAMLYGSGQATSTTLLVGTSTQSTGRTASNVSASFVNMSIATSAPFFTAPGVLVGPGTGYNAPGAGTFRTIVVGPSEYIVGTATTTIGGSQAAGYIPGLGSCTGAIEWLRI